MALKKSDLYSSLWASCDQLRGGMDASQYKDYVLFMLFIKYVSDKYANYAGFEPPVVIPKGASFADMAALKGKPDMGERINTDIIQPLVEANQRLSGSDFPNFNDPAKLGDGKEMVQRLTNLVAIFENPALDFAKHRAENDDLLGDAYEYLMRHFATESGKSKGQFYTPSEVSRVIAEVIGISPDNTVAATTAYDPTCGSGSLLLKVGAQAGKRITLEGQERDQSTAGLARMNMILHDCPTATILQGNTLADPKFKNGQHLRTYDYVIANPPFSDKGWRNGINPAQDPWQRFAWGEPPAKQGDYAYLLHIIRSLKATGKGACVMPHGVLFRGNAEATIRKKLIESGILKGIIGLPANLFYGTGIPACILVLDKQNAAGRRGIYMVDASRGFIKDGPKNRLRERDIHRIVAAFRQLADIPHYARMVSLAEIADAKNDYNLNLPRYLDTAEPEDLQDLSAHLNGGIPKRDIDALDDYWQVLPNVRKVLFDHTDRAGYVRLTLSTAEVRSAILDHADFAAFTTIITERFAAWREDNLPRLEDFNVDGRPKVLIHDLSESLLAAFRDAPLVDSYALYQGLMDYWATTMQDDAYLIGAEGWKHGAVARELHKIKDKNDKLVWPSDADYMIGKQRWKSDLVPAALLVARYFQAEQQTMDELEAKLAATELQLDEQREEQGGEDGLLAEVIDGEGDKQKITAKAIKDRLQAIAGDHEFADEAAALKAYDKLLAQQVKLKKGIKAAREDLDAKLHAKYPKLSEAEIKRLVVHDKWQANLAAAMQAEVERVSQTLTDRIRQLAERYAEPLPDLTAEVERLAAKVDGHLTCMGITYGGPDDRVVPFARVAEQ